MPGAVANSRRTFAAIADNLEGFGKSREEGLRIMVELLEQGAAQALPAHPPEAGLVTLGLEEELQVVDAHGALVAHDFARGQRDVPDHDGTSSRELHLCALEIKTPVCDSPDAIVASLATMRGVASRRAALQGQRVLSAGLHPLSAWTAQPTYDDPVDFARYARMQKDYGDVVRGALAFGMHVHLACADPALRMPVMNSLRNVLPDVLALSVSSPFSEGRDTGLACWRHAILGRLPRSGIPDVWRDEASYVAYLDRLRAVGSLHAGEGLWEDLRLHHVYGTLEVRICDATPSMDRVWLIVALLQAEVATLEDEVRRGCAPEPIARALLEDSKFRVCRHGMDAEVVDWHTGTLTPLPARLHAWLERVAPAAMRLGTLPRLARALSQALAEGTSSARQRAWMLDGPASPLIDRLVDVTARPRCDSLSPGTGARP